ncbi:type III secretion system protein [Pantoea vagans]|uniref:type III secretion system protein n=1 Tax=Pantoea vagans TaxID=470934 RepID=UPI0023AF69C3|nr:type III secretion system protein [Pantoea vagans]MDE8558591.1 type III secretion system protein [Pantoea vagans]MDE8578507.1 type III secretion system protein [Pantoea vagans]
MLLIEDEWQQQDSQLESLQQALNVLMPIRRQRLSRAQRQQRQQQALLAEAEAQQQAAAEQLLQEQQHYQLQRDRLQQQQSSREKLTRHVNNALSALQAVGQQQQQCQQAKQNCQQAAYALEQATEWTHEQQKAVEKLEYLSEHLEDA